MYIHPISIIKLCAVHNRYAAVIIIITKSGLVLRKIALARFRTPHNCFLRLHLVYVILGTMEFAKIDEIELPAAFDAHVHLRDGEMSQLVTPTIRQGGVNQVYVMVRNH